MNTLIQAVQGYIDGGFARFHMPGHKGRPLPGLPWGELARYDVTECLGLDSLYTADGPIRQTEEAYAALYGSKGSFLSAGGSTLCIQAMLALALNPGDKLLAGRGVHVAAVAAMALLDLHPTWLLPPLEEATGLAGATTPAQVEQALAADPELRAVYLTSPTYFGVLSDIAGIARVCHKRGVPLLVDNAHGAHLAFAPGGSLHPMAQGADACGDSLHKTLPVLTGGAMLHVGNERYLPRAKEKMALFGSTSPSYPILLSADAALSYLQGDFATDLERVSARLAALAQSARQRGFLLPDGTPDPLRLTLGGEKLGYTGAELGEWLRRQTIEPELVADRFCVLMASPCNREEDFARLEEALEALPPREPLPKSPAPPLTLPKPVMPLRQAVFAPGETVPLEEATGRVAGNLVAPCPPGIALVAAGEEIDGDAVRLLKNYGILWVNVVK